MFRLFVLALIAFNLAACTSYFKRKDCENINWFDHGKEVALHGQWLNSDNTLLECRKVEAKIDEVQLDQGFKAGMSEYCSGDKAYQVGKSGDNFSRDLCEGPSINSILARHAQGIRDYCSKANSFNAGSSGKKYQNVCPANLEKDFLPGYKRGRKKYVEAQIKDKEDQRQQLNYSIITTQSELTVAQGALTNLQNQRSFMETQRNGAMMMQNSSMVGAYDAQINALTSDISIKQMDVNSKQSELDRIRSNQTQLEKDISAFRSELPSLDE